MSYNACTTPSVAEVNWLFNKCWHDVGWKQHILLVAGKFRCGRLSSWGWRFRRCNGGWFTLRFFEELHNGDLCGCLHFLFVDLLVTFHGIHHLPPHLQTSNAVGTILITNDSLRTMEQEWLTQNDRAGMTHSEWWSRKDSFRMMEHSQLT